MTRMSCMIYSSTCSWVGSVLYRSSTNSVLFVELQSRFGDTLLEFQVVCPYGGTAVLKGFKPF